MLHFPAAQCGAAALRSCVCLRQCHRLLCHRTDAFADVWCDTLVTFGDAGEPARHCFTRPALGEAQSTEPPEEGEPGVQFFGVGAHMRELTPTTYE